MPLGVRSGMAVPAPEDAWQERVRQWAHAYRDIALAHPNLVLRIVSDPMAVAVAAVEANESLYAALESAGLDPGTVVRAADLIVDFVNGFILAHASGAAQDPHRRSTYAGLGLAGGMPCAKAPDRGNGQAGQQPGAAEREPRAAAGHQQDRTGREGQGQNHSGRWPMSPTAPTEAGSPVPALR